VLDSSKENIVLENFDEKIRSIKYFGSNQKVKYSYKKNSLKIYLDKEKINTIDTILEVDVKI
jgi:hypothetical protein